MFLNQKEITEIEPNIFALKALFSPSTGIIESHSYMKQLETLAVKNGAEMVYGNAVSNSAIGGDGGTVTVNTAGYGGSVTVSDNAAIDVAGGECRMAVEL